MKPTRLLSKWILCTLLVGTAYAQPLDLWQAARAGDAWRIRVLVDAGTPVDTPDEATGLTPLMHAAMSNQFGAIRELLRNGADPTRTNADGRTALQFVSADLMDGRACQLILRSYAFMQAHRRPSAGRPNRPNLVILFEPTVNYLHPRLKAVYHVNTTERDGIPGIDDDDNGFTDDIYGWNLKADRPHEINPLQLQIYLQGRDTIARLFAAHNDHELGRLPTADFQKLRQGYDNPLAHIFGRSAGFTNGDFLDHAINLSHGSHVAGIVIEHSQGKALLHTLSWESFGDATTLVTQPSIDHLARASSDATDFLARYRASLLAESLAEGRRLSDYLRATGAGVVNLSMGIDYEDSAQAAQVLAARYLFATQADDAEFERLWGLLPDLAFECYLAASVSFLVPMFENPDILFVISAGNDGADNDDSYQSPAYFSRLLPNALTVAAVDDEDFLAGFSNRGRLSVDLGAPGVRISSTAIPEASVFMDGTSMAAPAVAGVAAWVRAERPDLTASELKKFILYTAREIPWREDENRASLAGHSVTGKVLDESNLFQVAASPAERAATYAWAAFVAATATAEQIPDRTADADWLSREALQIDSTSGSVWRLRAACLDIRGESAAALEPIEHAVQLSPDDWSIWNSRGIIHGNLKNHREALASFDRALFAVGPAAPVMHRAQLFVSRALEHLALGDRPAALTDVQTARQLDTQVNLPADLQDLLANATDARRSSSAPMSDAP